MKNLLIIFAWCLTLTVRGQMIPFDSSAWTLEGKGAILEFHEGKSSLYLVGASAELSQADFKNGVIEFDMYLKDQWTFSGIYFRMQDAANFEELYFRPHRSGKPDAYQYCPRLNNKASWQLYHDQHRGIFTGDPDFYPKETLKGYNGKIDLPMDRWMHVKLVVAGQQAELYLDQDTEPRFVIYELKGPDARGPIGFFTGRGGVHFANFSFQKNEKQTLSKTQNLKFEELTNRIKEWQVSQPMEEEKFEPHTLTEEFMKEVRWKSLSSEQNGVTNLSRLAMVEDKNNTVVVKLEITASEDHIKAFRLGYSDRVRVYCNGTKLYSGNNGYRSRDFRFLGTIGLFDTIYLPLKKGKNVIYCAVSESFGGWGIMGQMDRDRIKIKGN